MDILNKNELKFMLVENTQVLGNYQYILSTNHPMPLFQVIAFETEADFQRFINANPYAFVQIPHYRIVLSLGTALNAPDLTQANAKEMAQRIREIMHDACEWFMKYKDYQNNPNFKLYKID